MAMLLKGGRVIDPSQRLDQVHDLLIVDGRITAIGADAAAQAGEDAEIINISGKVVCPGLVDLHTHLREPGFEYKEDIASGAKAGAAGGYTTLCCMPNTKPAIDSRPVVEYILQKGGEAGMGSVLPIGSLTKGMGEGELAEIGELVEAGVIALSDDAFPIQKADLMRRAMEYAAMFNIPVITHCEDKSLTEGGSMHEGYTSTVIGMRGMPSAAEEVMVSRNIILAAMTGCRLHIAHVSTVGEKYARSRST
jgi:dihydroorotase